MSKDDLENWEKIKLHMESLGKTDNYYYKRAVMILAGHDDPMENHRTPVTTDDSNSSDKK